MRPSWAGDTVTDRMINQEKHNEAMKRASKVKQLLRREAQGPGAAFRRDAVYANALSVRPEKS